MKKEEKIKKQRQFKRRLRTRKKLLGQKKRVRLSVFRSNKYIYAQIIDDIKGVTLVSASEKEIDSTKLNKSQKAEALGRVLAEKAKKEKIKSIVFDKGSYKYHGRIKALATGAREGGLEF